MLDTGSLKSGPCSAVGNMSDCRYVSDCRSRGRKLDPGLVPYFSGDLSGNNFYSHSPLFKVVVSYKRKYVHEALVNRLLPLAQEKSLVK